jgi:hypothetical protein
MTYDRQMNNQQLAAALGSGSPVLAASLDAHLRRHGTLIPHVFMGEVLAHVRERLLGAVNCAAEARRREISGILESLEQGMAVGDRETRNVIAISFVSRGEDQPFFAAILPLLGPRVRLQLLESGALDPSA